jgi:hypothetical protein
MKHWHLRDEMRRDTPKRNQKGKNRVKERKVFEKDK